MQSTTQEIQTDQASQIRFVGKPVPIVKSATM